MIELRHLPWRSGFPRIADESAPTVRPLAPSLPVGAGPARESRAGRAPTWEWREWRSVGADLIREPRRNSRLSRTRSAPTPSGKHKTRRMALSEAIPITTTAWVSPRLNPSVEARLGAAGKTVAPTVRPLAPSLLVGAGPARESRAGRAPIWEWREWRSVGADLIREPRRNSRLSRTRSAPTPSGKHKTRRMVLSEAIPITTTAWVSPRLNPSVEARLGAAGKTVAPTVRPLAPSLLVGAGPARESRAGRAPTGEWRGWDSVGADSVRDFRQPANTLREQELARHPAIRIAGTALPARPTVPLRLAGPALQ
ncbi:hypothetical protein J2T46_001950 [Pseudomonas citronellolis]|nr:hypothetical protein [Pseudomonas citronellolis]MCP1657315.1 hypothetical protein [Pseudomonas citronellolis]MCP1721899.1 hypothetical protein [Pseudomonas citronellolis]